MGYYRVVHAHPHIQVGLSYDDFQLPEFRNAATSKRMCLSAHHYRVPSKEQRAQKLKSYAITSALATALWLAVTLSYVTPRLGTGINPVAYYFVNMGALLVTLTILKVGIHFSRLSPARVQCYDQDFYPKPYSTKVTFWQSQDFASIDTVIVPMFILLGAAIALSVGTTSPIYLFAIVAYVINYVWKMSIYDLFPMLTDAVMWVEEESH